MVQGTRNACRDRRSVWRSLVVGAGLAVLTTCGFNGQEPPAVPVAAPIENPGAPPAPEVPSGVQLVGMEGDKVVALLGTPALQRKEEPAQYWRYSFRGCSIDMFLYEEGGSERQRVAWYEVRPPARVKDPAVERCRTLVDRLGPRPADTLSFSQSH